ncbi:hypothetical protein BJ546DRAFT_1070158 [Cryomyces antarcticus]
MVADQLAVEDPHKIYASVAKTSNIADGFRDVTILELTNAVNFMAWWLEEHFGRSDTFETIAYMGVSDIRYNVVFLAAVKCGYKLLIPSLRNSVMMNTSLFKTTGCTKIFYSEEVESRIRELEAGSPSLESHLMFPLDHMMKEQWRLYPYNKDFKAVEKDPILVCHTSGSTGSPKPITLSHGACSVWDAHQNIPKIEGRKNQDYALWDFEGGGRYYSSFPPFHLAGFVTMCFLHVMYPCTVVLGPPERPATGDMVCEIMRHFPLRAVSCAPSILEQIVQEDGGLRMAGNLDFVIYTGGPLSPAAGDTLSKVTDVCQLYGQSETGVIAALVPRREDWAFFEFQPAYGHTMELVGDEEYEMIIERDMSLAWMRGICHTFPEMEVWRTRDVFKPHPTKKDLWRFHGRTDDIMVLGNGEKFNPSPMEAIVQGHPLVGGALIAGQGRFQSCLIIEPKSNAALKGDELIDEIWGFVEQANRSGPGHAKIVRSLVAVVEPNTHFKRAGKGTVIRGQTTKACAGVIDKLYAEASSKRKADAPLLPQPFNAADVLPFVRNIISTLFPDLKIRDTDDFFNSGLDSLQTIELVSALRAGLQEHRNASEQAWLAVKTIYTRPSIIALSETLSYHLSNDGNTEQSNGNSQGSRISDMKRIVQRYTSDLPDLLPVSRPRESKLHVVLTGSTGSLGTHILEALMNDRKVRQITCMNRSADARQRHVENFERRGLGRKYHLGDSDVLFDARGIIGDRDLGSNVTFVKADFGHPTFGLPQTAFTELADDVDVIIHNAWKVDFNHSLASFEETHIRGVRHFIEWSIKSKKHSAIFFVSSISSVGNWPAGSTVPETPHEDYGVASQLGYGESKHVSERILSNASERSGVPTSILRVGQIAGPLKRNGGDWNKTEWLPCLVKLSLSMRLFPQTLPPIDWIPVDELAAIILEIVHGRARSNELAIFNLVNPHPTTWEPLVAPVMKRAGPHSRLVPTQQWVDALRQSDASDVEETKAKPALKILDFFDGIAKADEKAALRYRTENGVAASRRMKDLSAVRPEWMERWLDQWAF